MDRYIKMLIICLSSRYKVNLNHNMTYNHDKQRLSNVFTLSIAHGEDKPKTKTLYNKRDVVMELAKWQNRLETKDAKK